MWLGSTIAIAIGCALDALLGDPQGWPHLVRGIGALIAALERLLRRALPKSAAGERLGGALLALVVTAACGGVSFAVLRFAYRAAWPLGVALEALLCYQLLAARSLRDESMKVQRGLQSGDLERARADLAMIVGRDTDALDEAGVARAAVETVAENAADGVVAPLFYMLLGGGALACAYKAVNTMDSMIGYKNERYRHFGSCAARLDDAANFVPARLCALLLAASAALLGKDGKGAWRIWRRDRRNHASPNSAQSEAAVAGALGIRLGGDASYFGALHHKPTIGDDERPLEPEDIRRANRLMLCAGALMLATTLILRSVIFYAAL